MPDPGPHQQPPSCDVAEQVDAPDEVAALGQNPHDASYILDPAPASYTLDDSSMLDEDHAPSENLEYNWWEVLGELIEDNPNRALGNESSDLFPLALSTDRFGTMNSDPGPDNFDCDEETSDIDKELAAEADRLIASADGLHELFLD
ncbi:hypothetical protein KC19_2G232400 [Ceratodon purpureus]|uniref:Uncharacterized protein n=1 Tax=Ceratodon purpureus TaxID=3225 RepID=A0A8T0IZ95_CERPU|nr:hypothetical protein KC19_2G232400 [Ceratodon purpureus]